MGFSFDGPTKRINLTAGTTSISVRDMWSRWVDWFVTSDNSKYLPAFACVGGDDIDPSAGTKIPIYAFLMNGWKIKPQEANHTLAVTDGILLVDGGGDPFVNTTGAYIVRINYQQPVQAISFSSEGGGGSAPTVDDIWGRVIDSTLSAEQILRIVAAALAGKVSGAAGTSIVFRDLADTKNRIAATVDAHGNRTAVTLDAD